MTRTLAIVAASALVLLGCPVGPSSGADGGVGGPVHKQLGEACRAADGLNGGCEEWHRCYQGQCRTPCTTDDGCDYHFKGEICLNQSTERGHCSLGEMRCSAAVPCPDDLVCAGDGRCRTPCSCQRGGSLGCGFGATCPPWQTCTATGACALTVTDSCLWTMAGVTNVSNDCPRPDQACLAGACYGRSEPPLTGHGAPPPIDSCLGGTKRCGPGPSEVSVCANRGPGWRSDAVCSSAEACVEGCAVDAGFTACPDEKRTARCGCASFCDGESLVRSTCPPATKPVLSVCAFGTVCRVREAGWGVGTAECVPLVTPEPAPGLVTVGEPDGGATFGIDATEVTRAQYLAFLAARNAAGKLLDPVPGGCTSFASKPLQPAEWPWFDAPHRAASVNVCAARAYCEWAGKRLCGPIAARPDAGLAPGEVNDAGVDAWFAACSSGGRHVYPWGDTWDSSRCASRDLLEVGDMDVGSLPGCQGARGGWQGVFDLSGNREEWTDACAFNAQLGRVVCAVRGDLRAGVLPSEGLRCDALRLEGLSAQDFGFRCCSRAP